MKFNLVEIIPEDQPLTFTIIIVEVFRLYLLLNLCSFILIIDTIIDTFYQ